MGEGAAKHGRENDSVNAEARTRRIAELEALVFPRKETPEEVELGQLRRAERYAAIGALVGTTRKRLIRGHPYGLRRDAVDEWQYFRYVGVTDEGSADPIVETFTLRDDGEVRIVATPAVSYDSKDQSEPCSREEYDAAWRKAVAVAIDFGARILQ